MLHGLFSTCGKWGLLLDATCRFLIRVVSLVVEHKLQGEGFRGCGSQDLGHRFNMWLMGSVTP